MSRDYKKVESHGSRRRGGSSLLMGVFIGLILGLIIALMVAWYINKMPSPFSPRAPGIRGEADRLMPSLAPPASSGAPPAPAAAQGSTSTKQHFDFYKILPGGNDNTPPSQPAQASSKPAGAANNQAFFLQAGAFATESEAENMKARLALLGVEAHVQAGPSKGNKTVHRVRIGPFTDIEELNRTRETLKKEGDIPTTLVRVPESGK